MQNQYATPEKNGTKEYLCKFCKYVKKWPTFQHHFLSRIYIQTFIKSYFLKVVTTIDNIYPKIVYPHDICDF